MLLRLSEIFEVLFMFLTINFICSKKYRFCIYDLIFYLSAMIVLDCINTGYLNDIYMIIAYLLIAIYFIYKFRPKLKEFLVDLVVFLLCVSIIELIISAPMYLLKDTIPESIIFVLVTIFSSLVVLLLGIKKILYRLTNMIKESNWVFYLILGCCGMGAVYLIIVSKFTYSLRGTDYLIFGLWTILICVLAALWQKSRNEVEVKKKEMLLQKTYEDVYQNLVRSIRQRQHEFDNHIVAICGLNKTAVTLEELVEEQNEYIGQIEENNRYNRLLSVESPTLVGFLYSKFIQMEEKGCKIDYFVKVSEDSDKIIPEYRIIEILGILIDNALEAVIDKIWKSVYVEVINTKKELQISVRNISNYIPQKDIYNFVKPGYTTKGKDRGIGLSSLVSIVNRYAGEITISNMMIEGVNWLLFKVVFKK